MNALPWSRPIAVAVAALFCILVLATESRAQDVACCEAAPPSPVYLRQATVIPPEPAPPSWIFDRSTYSHDPYTGARVAQYEPIPPVEPLDDQRLVTSRYRRSRTNIRGADGSFDTYYEVQQWGNGRGGLDAEWERFHDAWKGSYLSGGYYNQQGGNFNQGPYAQGPYGPGQYGNPWAYGGPGWGGGFGYGGPGFGGPGFGGPGFGGPGYGGPGPGFGPPGYGNSNGPGHGNGWGQNGPGHGNGQGGSGQHGSQNGGGNHSHDD